MSVFTIGVQPEGVVAVGFLSAVNEATRTSPAAVPEGLVSVTVVVAVGLFVVVDAPRVIPVVDGGGVVPPLTVIVVLAEVEPPALVAVWVAVTSSNIAPAMRGQGIPMKFVMPAEGSPSVNGGLSMVKGGPCEAAAYEYLDLYYSDEFQAMRMRAGTASPSQTAWNLLAPAERQALGFTADEFPKLVNLDWAKVNADRPEWIKRWQREIK